MTSKEHKQLMSVEVVVAMPDRQVIEKLRLPEGATVAEAIERSGVAGKFDGLVIDPKMLGIFGSKVPIGQLLSDGDRVEIYRPLIADPKEVRRQRAERQAKASE